MEKDIGELSILKLAFLGDAVYELCIRKRLTRGKYSLKEINKKKVSMVNAKSQAKLLHNIIPHLTEEEFNFINRAKNTKAKVPKSSNQKDYRYATALEAFFGVPFLQNNINRIVELIERGWENESDIA